MAASQFYLVLTLTCIHGGVGQTTTASSKKYLDNCIIDKNLPASNENNYMDCSKNTEKPDCCLINKKVNCCNEKELILRLVLIVTAILLTTLFVAIVCFLVFWGDQWPWLSRVTQACHNRCPTLRHKQDAVKEEKSKERTAPMNDGSDTDLFWTTP